MLQIFTSNVESTPMIHDLVQSLVPKNQSSVQPRSLPPIFPQSSRYEPHTLRRGGNKMKQVKKQLTILKALQWYFHISPAYAQEHHPLEKTDFLFLFPSLLLREHTNALEDDAATETKKEREEREFTCRGYDDDCARPHGLTPRVASKGCGGEGTWHERNPEVQLSVQQKAVLTVLKW